MLLRLRYSAALYCEVQETMYRIRQSKARCGLLLCASGVTFLLSFVNYEKYLVTWQKLSGMHILTHCPLAYCMCGE